MDVFDRQSMDANTLLQLKGASKQLRVAQDCLVGALRIGGNLDLNNPQQLTVLTDVLDNVQKTLGLAVACSYRQKLPFKDIGHALALDERYLLSHLLSHLETGGELVVDWLLAEKNRNAPNPQGER